MMPTALSQLVEALGKLFLGLGFAAFGMYKGFSLEVCTALAILGITIGEGVAAVGIWVYYLRDPARHARGASREYRGSRQLVHNLLWLVIPITLTNSVTSLTTLVDTTMVVSRLQSIGYSLKEANELFGMYNGKAFTMYNLPQTLIAALAISIVPAIAGAMAQKNSELTAKNLGSAMRIAMLIALPAGTGYFILSEPIIDMLFAGDPHVGAACLRVLAFAIPFVALVQSDKCSFAGSRACAGTCDFHAGGWCHQGDCQLYAGGYAGDSYLWSTIWHSGLLCVYYSRKPRDSAQACEAARSG